VPSVYVSRFVQTHVRVYRDDQTTHVELWEHPRPVTQRLRAAERVAVAGRLLAEPDAVRHRACVPEPPLNTLRLCNPNDIDDKSPAVDG
jgi:hypothetical protein